MTRKEIMRLITAEVNHLSKEEKIKWRASERANDKAFNNMERRLEGMNEFRSSLKDQTASFITRAEFYLLKDQTDSYVTKKELQASKASTISLCGLIVAIIAVIVVVLIKVL